MTQIQNRSNLKTAAECVAWFPFIASPVKQVNQSPRFQGKGHLG